MDAWTIQRIMRSLAAADTHAGLVQSGRDLAATIQAHGPDGWTRLLGSAVAHAAPAARLPAAAGEVDVQKAQFAAPAGPVPLPLPPAFIPGTRENRALTDATLRGIRRLGDILTGPSESQRHDDEEDEEEGTGRRRPLRARPKPSEPADAASNDGETRDKPPPNSRPINETPWSGDHTPIKSGIDADPADDVRIAPNDDVWRKNPDGTWTNCGPASDFTRSGKPSGRTGAERDRRSGS